jgi:hypothetical protein
MTPCRYRTTLAALATVGLFPFLACGGSDSFDRADLSFFVTSVQAGNGGQIGGLAGADAHCQKLAQAVGSQRKWRAYLSATDGSGQPIHARHRIGQGPWVNANGEIVASSVEELHGSPGPSREVLHVHENGRRVGLPHDIMTGSTSEGTLAEGDLTCRNWSSTAGRAMLGHSNRIGSCCGDRAQSWNSAHPSQGCSLPGLSAMGGAALFYCFAVE